MDLMFSDAGTFFCSLLPHPANNESFFSHIGFTPPVLYSTKMVHMTHNNSARTRCCHHFEKIHSEECHEWDRVNSFPHKCCVRPDSHNSSRSQNESLCKHFDRSDDTHQFKELEVDLFVKEMNINYGYLVSK